MPLIRLNVVDLPAPFGPMMRVALALRDAQVEIADDRDVAEAFLHGLAVRWRRSCEVMRPLLAGDAGRVDPRRRATRRQVMRATRKPPTSSTAASAQVDRLAASKPTPNARMCGSVAGIDGVVHDGFDRKYKSERSSPASAATRRGRTRDHLRRALPALSSGRCIITRPAMPPGANITTAMKIRPK